MRSRSIRKWAHRNAGDLGSRLVVCACAYDPIHVTAQGKRLDPICACVQLSSSILIKTMPRMWIQFLCASVLYSYGVTWAKTLICDVNQSPDLNARFWLVETKSAALWLVRTWCSHYDYSCFTWATLFEIGINKTFSRTPRQVRCSDKSFLSGDTMKNNCPNVHCNIDFGWSQNDVTKGVIRHWL